MAGSREEKCQLVIDLVWSNMQFSSKIHNEAYCKCCNFKGNALVSGWTIDKFEKKKLYIRNGSLKMHETLNNLADHTIKRLTWLANSQHVSALEN